MNRTVTIKVLRDAYSTDERFVKRFVLEARTIVSLQHPNIVQAYDYGHTNGIYYIIMEFVEDTDLRRYLRSHGVLEVNQAIIIAHDVALALGTAHHCGIVHNAVKHADILLGNDGSIKLTDFGTAMVFNATNFKDLDPEWRSITGITMGSIQYTAPEQAQGESVTPAADVYALGIIIYEMLTGRPLFDGDSPIAIAMKHIHDAPLPPSQLNPNIPPALEEIILLCLEKVPKRRFRDGFALALALETLSEQK